MKSVKVRPRKTLTTALVSAILLALLGATTVLASPPVAGHEGQRDPGPPPLSKAEQASLDLKHALVRDYIRGGSGATTLGVTAVCKPGQPPPCYWPQPDTLTVATHARHQHRWFYCGAAVVQVVSNYTWGYTSSSLCGAHCDPGINKYGQHTISDNWTLTDVHGETYVGDLKTGMNSASDLPSGFLYAYEKDLVWSDFHSDLRLDIWWWHMPLAARVDPRHSGSQYFLTSWAGDPAGDYGHYIALRGYSGTAQSTALAYYNDSSGGVDEHDTSITVLGDTGAFSDNSYTVYRTMKQNNAGGHWYLFW